MTQIQILFLLFSKLLVIIIKDKWAAVASPNKSNGKRLRLWLLFIYLILLFYISVDNLEDTVGGTCFWFIVDKNFPTIPHPHFADFMI